MSKNVTFDPSKWVKPTITTTPATGTTTTTPAVATPAPVVAVSTTPNPNIPSCVQRSTLECISNAFSKWPKCSTPQIKASTGGSGGLYCEQNWVDALNEMLSDPVANICGNQAAISNLLAQVAATSNAFTSVSAGLLGLKQSLWEKNA